MKRKSAPPLNQASGVSLPERYDVEPQSRLQSKPTAMSAHNLKHKRARVTRCRRVDVVDSFANTRQSRRRANSQVCQGHVVVDRPDETDNLQVSVLDRLLFRDSTYRGDELNGESDVRLRVPCERRSATREGHSERKTSAPVREPSPPQTASASMPSLIKLLAAWRRPSGVRNVCDRAVPARVPPCRFPSVSSMHRRSIDAPLQTIRAHHPILRGRCISPSTCAR